jgi:hypothetical protein
MSERHALIAFCAVIAAICYLASIAAILAYSGRYAEALGFGGLTTGLVGIAGTFKPATTKAVQNVDHADTATVGNGQ